jgi:hypothetical protein
LPKTIGGRRERRGQRPGIGQAGIKIVAHAQQLRGRGEILQQDLSAVVLRAVRQQDAHVAAGIKREALNAEVSPPGAPELLI